MGFLVVVVAAAFTADGTYFKMQSHRAIDMLQMRYQKLNQMNNSDRDIRAN